MVNQEGFRFVRENASYKEIGEAALQQSNGKSFIILDERARKLALRTDPREKDYMADPTDIKHGFSANNLRDLAVKSGINPENLERTVKQYNETAPNGTDSLGRDTLTFKFGKPFALLTPPFIALPATSALLTTYCGLCINEKCRSSMYLKSRYPDFMPSEKLPQESMEKMPCPEAVLPKLSAWVH